MVSIQSAPERATDKNGKRSPSQPRNQITSPVITFHNHIDLKTGEPAFGRWVMSIWQRMLRQSVAERFHVTVNPVEEKVSNKKEATVNYGRAATLTGAKTNIDTVLKEYDREQSAIYLAARKAYAAAAGAEAAKDEKAVTRFNPDSLDWAPYWNSFGLGAVRAYRKLHGLDVETVPKPKHQATGAIGETYRTATFPVAVAAPKPAAKSEAKAQPAAKAKPAAKPKAKGAMARHERQEQLAKQPEEPVQTTPLAEVLAQSIEQTNGEGAESPAETTGEEVHQA